MSPAVAAPVLAEIWSTLETLTDPEIPVITLREMGILRDVRTNADGTLEVVITPTYSGCPAMGQIEDDIVATLAAQGMPARVVTQLAPAWTTDWMSEDGRRKLREYGIAPPVAGSGRRALFGEQRVECPQCGSANTELLSEFGSTSCKALWRCRNCCEPFDYFKCH